MENKKNIYVIPTALEIIQKHTTCNPEEEWERNGKFCLTNYKEAIIEFAKLHVEAALKEANKKAIMTGYIDSGQTILNAYPLTLIK